MAAPRCVGAWYQVLPLACSRRDALDCFARGDDWDAEVVLQRQQIALVTRDDQIGAAYQHSAGVRSFADVYQEIARVPFTSETSRR